MDLLVSDDQKIIETMRVLEGKGLIGDAVSDSVKYVKSLRTNNQVNILLTYQEGKIYAGDILEL